MEELKRPRIRFGVFEVDLQSRELRKQGFKVKLQEQPFHILLMLVERPGDIVTREEIQKRLWPADTFVDFDRRPQPGDQQAPRSTWGPMRRTRVL